MSEFSDNLPPLHSYKSLPNELSIGIKHAIGGIGHTKFCAAIQLVAYLLLFRSKCLNEVFRQYSILL